ncbi:hypothetical protein MBLNU459_g8493t2 [Dothideomycetes sp. NU459]
MATNRTVDFALRALQLIFAIIVMGTDGYAIHSFRSHTVHVHTDFGDFYQTYGVPNSWGFLMFCAGWTFLVVIFLLLAKIRFAGHALIGYICVTVEALTLLSWFAGFIAVAVEIGTDAYLKTHANPHSSCGAASAFSSVWSALILYAGLMVSHLEPPDQLIPRRPPSVASRASSSRRHRSSRSNHAASDPASRNEFPVFALTGDVDITITSINGRRERRYILHRLILSQSSGFFDVDTNTGGGAATSVPAPPHGLPPPQTALSRIGESDNEPGRSSADLTAPRRSNPQPERRRWRYVLDWGNTPDDQVPLLVQRDPSSSFLTAPVTPGPPPATRNKPPPSSTSFFRTMSNLSALNISDQTQPLSASTSEDEYMRDYDNLFRIFYNYPPSLDSVNIATAYTECKALLHLADVYDALDIVGSRVDHHLLRFQGRLFKQIAKYPPSYLKLAYLARSKVIFAEALVHVVGQWPLASPQLRGQIDRSVMELIEDKIDELEEMKAKIEVKLFRLTLTTTRGDRVTPSNSFLDWLVMSLFRQWIAENTTPPPASILKDTSSRPSSGNTAISRSSAGRIGHVQINAIPHRSPQASPPSQSRGHIYRLLGSTANSAYLPHDELKRFLKMTSELYTRENLRRFERRMDELKNLARDIVKPLTRNTLELDLSTLGSSSTGSGVAGSLGYLTCTRVLEEDFPWDDD